MMRPRIYVPLVVAVLLVAPSPASAHARLVRSKPAEGAKLTAVEASRELAIDLWFSELLDRAFNSIEVFPASEVAAAERKSLATAPASVDAQDRTHLRSTVGSLPSGAYVVEWQVLSRDGHTARGRVTFRVTER